MSLFDATIELKLTLGYWKRPTIWDRITQDEPLDTPKSEFVSTIATNSTTASPIQIPTSYNYTVTPILVNLPDHTQVILRHNQNGRVEDESLYLLNKRVKDGSFNMRHTGTSQWQPKEFHYGLGLNIEPVYHLPAGIPYPRTSKEQRILNVLGENLPVMIKKASKVLGPHDGSAEWNHRFFDFVSRARVQNAAVARHQAKGPLPRRGSR